MGGWVVVVVWESRCWGKCFGVCEWGKDCVEGLRWGFLMDCGAVISEILLLGVGGFVFVMECYYVVFRALSCLVW